MNIESIETLFENGQVTVKYGQGCLESKFSFKVPDDADKNKMEVFSQDVLCFDTSIVVGTTKICYDYKESMATFVMGKQGIVLKHTEAPEALREALSDMFVIEGSASSEGTVSGERKTVTKKSATKKPAPKYKKIRPGYGKYVSQAIYGFCIDKSNIESIKDYDPVEEAEDFFNDIVEDIKLTEDTKQFKYYITDFEFKDSDRFREGSTVLIVGIPFNKLKAHYSGVMTCRPDVSTFNAIPKFLELNPLFKNIEPQIFIYTDLQK